MVIKKKGNKKAVYIGKILKKYIYKKSIFVKKLQITLHFSCLICLFEIFHKNTYRWVQKYINIEIPVKKIKNN